MHDQDHMDHEIETSSIQTKIVTINGWQNSIQLHKVLFDLMRVQITMFENHCISSEQRCDHEKLSKRSARRSGSHQTHCMTSRGGLKIVHHDDWFDDYEYRFW